MEKDYQILRDLEQSLLQEFTIIHKREQYNDINWDFQFI
jgi:hypothetical protein